MTITFDGLVALMMAANMLRKIAEDRGLDVRVKSSTDQLHNVAVQGPKESRDFIKNYLDT